MKTNTFAFLSITGVLVLMTWLIRSQNNNDWVAPPEADKLKNPFAGQKATARGENLYSFNCGRCHGNYGKGDGIDGRKLKPSDLTSEKVQKQSDGAIFWKLSTGRGSMDSFEKVLVEKDRWQLVNYIRDLAKTRNAVSLKENQ